MTWYRQWSTSVYRIQWITIVTGSTATLCLMLIGQANGISTARNIFAHILALWFALMLDTCCTGRTIIVRQTFDGRTTTFIVRITDQISATRTLERSLVVATSSSRTARHIPTEINDVTLRQRIARKTWLTIAHLSVIFGRTKSVHAARIVAHKTSNLTHVSVA